MIGHYGIENMVGFAEMDRLAQRVIQAEKEGNKTIAQLARQVDATQPDLDDTRRAKEIIAVMAERNIQNAITRRVLDAIRKFLKSIGFLEQDITDAKIARLLREEQDYLRAGNRAMVAGEPAGFSLSAMKSVEANISRGREALAKALLQKTNVHRAMYRNVIGWIDFVWGDGKKGIAHIIQGRMVKDGFSYEEAVRLLTQNLVETIARGKAIKHLSTG